MYCIYIVVLWFTLLHELFRFKVFINSRKSQTCTTITNISPSFAMILYVRRLSHHFDIVNICSVFSRFI